MPIITVQRRMAEQGRIRLGQKVTTSNGRTRPAKLDRFRFTSPNKGLIDQVAGLYGGDVKPWDNDGKNEFEVLTDATAIPVIVVKGGFSQWHETWSRAGCLHRCDGEKDVTGTYCDPEDPNHQAALEKPTTRLSVMLAEVESLGVWRMESHGWNAAAELPSMAELAIHVGDLVPATLHLVERSAVITNNGKPQTSRFVVPVLDLHVSKARLVEIAGGVNGVPAIGSGPAAAGAPQIEAAAAAAPDYAALLEAATTKEECAAIWRTAGEAGHLDEPLKDAISARAAQLAPQDAPTEIVEGEVEDDRAADDSGDADAAWMSTLAAAGNLGMSTDQVVSAFESWAALPVDEGSAQQFRDFTEALQAGEIGDAA